MLNRMRMNEERGIDRSKKSNSRYGISISLNEPQKPFLFYLQLTKEYLICKEVENCCSSDYFFPNLFEVYHFMFFKAYIDVELSTAFTKEELFKKTRNELGIKNTKKYKLIFPKKEIAFPLDYRRYESILNTVQKEIN